MISSACCLKNATFANWVQKRRKAGGEPAAVWGAVRLLLEAVVGEESRGVGRSAGLLLELPGGCRVRVETPLQLALGGGVGQTDRPREPGMLSFTGALKVFVALEPVDLRKSFNGLEELVRERLGEGLRAGALFVFSNRRHTRLKILYWDGSGLWLLIKRLEKGTFSWPRVLELGQVKLKLAPEALAMLTDGIDLRGARLRPWYVRD